MSSKHHRLQPSRRFGAMMRKLDQRGVAALEFCLVAGPLFLLMFLIFDLGLYAIHVQSLRSLADAGARAMMMKCYTPTVIGIAPRSPWSATNTSPSSCNGCSGGIDNCD